MSFARLHRSLIIVLYTLEVDKVNYDRHTLVYGTGPNIVNLNFCRHAAASKQGPQRRSHAQSEQSEPERGLSFPFLFHSLCFKVLLFFG